LIKFDLAGTDWVLLSIGGETLPTGTRITTRFDADGVAGLAGCNNYFARHEVAGETLAISELGMTMMACPRLTMELEKIWRVSKTCTTSKTVLNHF
jgi:heat shock protein HslJ